MEKYKKLPNNSKQEDGEISYSLSSISLHVKRNDFEKDENLEIYIKDKDKLLKEYTILKKIGQGTFGVVVSAIHIKTNEKVAIKILEKQKIIQNADINRIKKEIDILKQLRHKNIVQLYNVIDTLTHIYLIMEYVNGIELFDYIIKKKRIDELESCHFYQQIISGIEYLGNINIVHRDIKPENLLVDKNKKIKIVDFGLSNSYKNNELLSTACGSPFYAAPEMIKGEKYNGTKVDIWSSGIVLFAMICGFLPFDDKDNEILYQKIIEGKIEYPSFVSDEAIDFISHILNVDPNKRYNINDIKKHFWFNKINPKINMTDGLILNKFIIPFDEKIILFMKDKFNLNIKEIKKNILLNKYNQLTTIYYLLLNKKIRNNEDTIGDTSSKLFIEYIHNKKNLLSFNDWNFDKIINERIKENKNINKKDGIKRRYTNNSSNKINNNSKSIPNYHIRIDGSSGNTKKAKEKYEFVNHNENNGNELRITKININNIIIPKNFINYSEIKKKQKKIFFPNNNDLNKSQDIKRNKKQLNQNEIKIKNFKSFNKTQNNINNDNDLKINKIKNIYINLKDNNDYETLALEKNPLNNQNKIILNKIKAKNSFCINKIINNKSQQKEKVNILHRNIARINDINNYNQTMKISYINTTHLNEKYFPLNKRKTKKEIMASYKKKKVLSYSFQKQKNILNNEFIQLNNNLNNMREIIDNHSLDKKNINYIEITDIPHKNNFYSTYHSPKSKLYTYKRIKVPNKTKNSNISGRTESFDSNKNESIRINPSFNTTYENYNDIISNRKERKINIFDSLMINKERNIDEKEIFFKNPIIEHVYNRNTTNENINKKTTENYSLTDRNNNDNNIMNINKEKLILFNKFKKIYQKANFDKNKIKNNKLIISSNLTNISNSKINNQNLNISNHNYNIYYNKNNISIKSNYTKTQIINNKDLTIKPLNTNIYFFKKNNLYNNKENDTIKNKSIMIKKKYKNHILQKNSKDIKNTISNNKYIQNFENKNYMPFDLASIVFYNKENEIKNSLIKNLNMKRVKFNEKKNKISCFKKDLRFELNIVKLDINIFIIKFLRKEERNNFYNNLFLNIINIYSK